MIDYAAKYGLKFNPFLKNTKDILLQTAEASEARVRLDYLGNTKGFGILTGEPGRGKTTSARLWAASLNPSLFKVSYSSLSTLTVMDFYRQLAFGLGAEPSFRKSDLFNDIQREVKRYALEKRSLLWSSLMKRICSAIKSCPTYRSCSTLKWTPGTLRWSFSSGSPV